MLFGSGMKGCLRSSERMGLMVSGIRRSCLRGIARNCHIAILKPSGPLRDRHGQSHLQHPGAYDWLASWFNVSGGIGKPGGQVAAISRITEHIDLLTGGSDGLVYSTWWDASGVGPGGFSLGGRSG